MPFNMMWFKIFIVAFLIDQIFTNDLNKVYWLKSGMSQSFSSKIVSQLDIFCYTGKPFRVKYMLSFPKLQWDFNESSSYVIYKGNSSTDLLNQYKASNFFKLFPWRFNTISMDTFHLSCVGIYTKDPYTIKFNFEIYNKNKVALALISILLYIFAPHLARNESFYYMSGISFGNIASILVIIYILSRLIPQRKTATYLILAGGWSFGIYVLQHILQNIRQIITAYPLGVAAYIGLVSFISFAICYWRGPPQDIKSITLIKWGIRLISLCGVAYAFRNNAETSIIIPVLLIALDNLARWRSRLNPLYRGGETLKLFYRKKFPPHIKLLTEEEYIDQGRVETEKQLKELRDYCTTNYQRSPWQVAKKLKEPLRFLAFIEGDADHITNDEYGAWESDLFDKQIKKHENFNLNFPEDEISSDEELNSIKYNKKNNLTFTYNGNFIKYYKIFANKTINGDYRGNRPSQKYINQPKSKLFQPYGLEDSEDSDNGMTYMNKSSRY